LWFAWHRKCLGNPAVNIRYQAATILAGVRISSRQRADRSTIPSYLYDKRSSMRNNFTGERTQLARNRIICFRLDPEIIRRISCVLGPRYSTRSIFIRTAIEKLLSQEEARIRLLAAEAMIEWG
jgi:hypothetical protein